ncbi:streptophobe family protein [Streptomyces sp. FIT100]|uniref:streptophobe family protein n=1 Tax=Streptomyces sp. FIT100 TaxID=2837956 RepID=UPI0021C6B73C|nr:streptophobe family protein [Streptomyces sp. FIT100]
MSQHGGSVDQQGSPGSRRSPRATGRGGAARAVRDWGDALLAVVAGLLAMVVVASLGLWAAGGAGLPGGASPHLVAAVVVMAAGGTVELAGDAGVIAESQAELTALPLSVSLVGALVTAWLFLRPLRHRAVAGTGELLARFGRLALLWLLGLAGLAALARYRFDIPLGEDSIVSDIGELLDASPQAGFAADTGLTLLFGLLWLIGVVAVALLVSRKAPLPARLVRFQESVRPAAFAMVALLLGYVVLGLCAGLVVAATQGHAGRTFAVILLGLPNLVWLAFTLGLGASWDGRVDGPFGLPMPRVLDEVLRTPEGGTVNLSTLAERDGRVWWLLVIAAVLVVAAAFLMAVRSPARMPPWRHAVHMAVALALTVLVVCLLVRVEARYGLSLIGIGEVAGLGGEVALSPRLWSAVGLAVAWGLVAGFLGALLATRVQRRGEVPAP